MLFDYLRIIRKLGSDVEDISLENQEETASSGISLAAGTDHILIGMPYPFNNFFMHMDEVNGARDVGFSIAIDTPYNPVGPVAEIQEILPDNIPTQGTFKLSLGSDETDDLGYGSTAAEIQAAIRLWSGFNSVTVSGDWEDGFLITFTGVAAPALIEVTDSTLARIEPSELELEYWDGSKWVAAVDILDGTSVSGATLSRSGHVLFNLDFEKTGWGKVMNPTQLAALTELSGRKIFNQYWLKLKVTGAIPADVTFKELGFCWTSSDKMKIFRPEIDRYMPSIKAGKTNWIPEMMMAAKLMTAEYKKANLVYGPQQVIRLDDVWVAATYKALWIIFSALGPAYLEQAKEIHHQFYKNMNVDNVTLDQDKNGRVSEWEKDSKVKTGVR